MCLLSLGSESSSERGGSALHLMSRPVTPFMSNALITLDVSRSVIMTEKMNCCVMVKELSCLQACGLQNYINLLEKFKEAKSKIWYIFSFLQNRVNVNVTD